MTQNGYGFVVTPEGDFYFWGGDAGVALLGDTVVVRPDPQRGKKGWSGAIVRVLERAHSTLVGTYEKSGMLGIVRPADPRIMHDVFVSSRREADAKTGDVVVVRIDSYPRRDAPAQGYIEEIVGRADDPAIGVEIIIREHGLRTEFPEAALCEASKLDAGIDSALRGESERRDIRDRFVFTIDPTDARDFDDAISLDWVDGRLRLGVHIADVSHYVRWESSLDIEARARATSVYLVDRVLPMLPERLSNKLCSLNPGEDKLAFTVDMYLSKDGAVEQTEIYPSAIRSSLRLDYGQVDEMFAGEREFPDSQTQKVLTDFAQAARRVYDRKIVQGRLDFETVETKVLLDDAGAPSEVVLRQRTQATSMIEEAMILANESVAAHMTAAGAPMVYRIHEEPDSDALEALAPILSEFGYPVNNLNGATPLQFQRILDRASGRPEEQLVNSLVLRAMQRAKYVTYASEHFGLASESYTHFTSPIRRYPDLLVHRLLRAQLRGELDRDPDIVSMVPELDWLAEHSSAMEREAESAAQESVTLKLCEYMQQFLGDEFGGFITGVVSYGLFVRLENSAEGLVRTNVLDEPFTFDPIRHTLTGDVSGTRYRLGERVRVILKNVSPGDRRIDFSLI